MIKISDTEFEVMKVIWNRKQATSIEIIEDLKNFNWNYNTIRTLIRRLQLKGAIKPTEKKGRFYTYIPLIDESKYKSEVMMNLVKKLYNNSAQDFILDWCKYNNVDIEEIKKILEYKDSDTV